MKTVKWMIHRLVLLSAVGFVGQAVYQHVTKPQSDALSYHCHAINADPSRPSNRMCVKPYRLEKDRFVFQTGDNVMEVYNVISSLANPEAVDEANNHFDYTFVEYLKGTPVNDLDHTSL